MCHHQFWEYFDSTEVKVGQSMESITVQNCNLSFLYVKITTAALSHLECLFDFDMIVCIILIAITDVTDFLCYTFQI